MDELYRRGWGWLKSGSSGSIRESDGGTERVLFLTHHHQKPTVARPNRMWSTTSAPQSATASAESPAPLVSVNFGWPKHASSSKSPSSTPRSGTATPITPERTPATLPAASPSKPAKETADQQLARLVRESNTRRVATECCTPKNIRRTTIS